MLKWPYYVVGILPNPLAFEINPISKHIYSICQTSLLIFLFFLLFNYFILSLLLLNIPRSVSSSRNLLGGFWSGGFWMCPILTMLSYHFKVRVFLSAKLLFNFQAYKIKNKFKYFSFKRTMTSLKCTQTKTTLYGV